MYKQDLPVAKPPVSNDDSEHSTMPQSDTLNLPTALGDDSMRITDHSVSIILNKSLEEGMRVCAFMCEVVN